MDILEEIPFEKWPYLQEKLLVNWPRNFAGYHALEKSRQHPELRDSFQFKVYCPYGDVDNGFIATSLRGRYTTFIMSPLTHDTKKLEEAITHTKVLNWVEGVMVNDISSKAFQILSRVKPVIGLDFTDDGIVKMHFLDRKTAPFNDASLPDATYLAQLKPTDIQRVGETWFGDYANSYTYFSNLVTFSYGLYSRSSDELLAWVFTNEQDLIRHLYCEKDHRKKGYGEYLLKYIINDQLRQGKDLCCFVSGSNEPSLRLFKKHGFQVVDDFHYATVKYAQEC